MKKAVFDLGSAGCVSCKRAIEHAGRHIKGINDIDVDIASHKIRLTYEDGEGEALDKLTAAVRMIGYEAVPVSEAQD